jgi:hypothetical protein
MLATAFGFVAGAVATGYWFIHGFVMGTIERLDKAAD